MLSYLIDFVAGDDEAEVHVARFATKARDTRADDVEPALVEIVTLLLNKNAST